VLQVTESQFQDSVVELARICGWKVHHAWPTQVRPGKWITAAATGFPDLVLVHETLGLLFAELKTDTGKLSDAQVDWLGCLTLAGVEAVVWKPSDWKQIQQRLTGAHR
jgi:hypothetical protein